MTKPETKPARSYPNTAFLEETVRRAARSRPVHGAILRVENGEGSLAWTAAAGNLTPDQQYHIASVTKLYVTVVVLRLRDEGRLGLDDPIGRYLAADLIQGLHVLNGVDRSDEITILHLISNASAPSRPGSDPGNPARSTTPTRTTNSWAASSKPSRASPSRRSSSRPSSTSSTWTTPTPSATRPIRGRRPCSTRTRRCTCRATSPP